MKPSERSLKKWRKNTPMRSRSYGEKRERGVKAIRKEIDEYQYSKQKKMA